ncbi:MAG: hypothetical protein JJU02_05495 [Cryomorphaceae bacterium]|nr:hypothetical protein [Cryomorphaceae bacterium]
MEFLQSKFVWGIIVVLIGLSMILNDVFKINIPLFKIIIAVFFIYIGVRIMSGTFTPKGTETASVFGDSKVYIENVDELQKEYTIIFGSQTIDLSNVTLENDTDKIQFNVVFGSAKVIIGENHKIKVNFNNVLGNTSSPAPPSNTENMDSGKLLIEGNVVFGNVKIVRKP